MVRALFPGTFDPIHYGHMDIANRASKLFDEVVMAVYDKPLKNLMFSNPMSAFHWCEAFQRQPEDQSHWLQRVDD
jgi:cytidyltransferase-like protein